MAALPDHSARVMDAFRVVYGRTPDETEKQAAMDYLSDRSTEVGVKQLLWAMLTGAEFQLNH